MKCNICKKTKSNLLLGSCEPCMELEVKKRLKGEDERYRKYKEKFQYDK